MATNPYFKKGVSSEQALMQSLITESIKIQGQDVYYLPRKLQKLDLIFGEDVLSKFDTAVQIEMYMMDRAGWQGENDMIQKFGLRVTESMDFVVSKPRWLEATAGLTMFNNTRPQEGDLIYEPVTDNLYEITYVSIERPFFQLNKTYQWTISCSQFVYNNEKLDTGISEIDNIENDLGNDLMNLSLTPKDEHSQQENAFIQAEAPQYNFDINDPFSEVKR